MTSLQSARIIAVTLLVSLFAFVAPAAAATPEQEAQQYFEKGAALYFEGEYGQALVQFKKGHATLPNSLFQYNIALCNLKLERYREALTAAQEAERMGQLGEKEQTLNTARIASIPRLQKAEQVAELVAANQVEVATDDSDADVTTTTASEPQKGGFGGLGWAGVGFTTVGVGMLVGALVVEAGLQSKWDEFNSTTDTERFDELKLEIEKRQTAGKILLFGGLGVSAVGVTLLIAELVTGSSDKEQPVSLYVTPNGDVGVGAHFRF